MSTVTFGKRGKEALKESPGRNFNKTYYFNLKDGERAILRFLTDFTGSPSQEDPSVLVGGWPVFDMHQNIPTKQPPTGYSGNWPGAMGCVCRLDEQFMGQYPDCYICDVLMPNDPKLRRTSRYWAIACEREEVTENGQVVGYRDKTRSFTRKNEAGEEEKVEEKALVVVNLAWKNFFSLLDRYGSRYKTVLDRDYEITRTGKSTDTVYTLIPLDPIETTIDGKSVPFDVRNPAIMARYLPKAKEIGYAEASDLALGEIIGEKSSDDYFARFFDRRVAVSNDSPASTEVVPPPVAVPVTPPGHDLPEDQVAALAARVRGYDAPEEATASAGVRDFG